MFILNAQKSFEIPLFKMGHLVKLLLWQMAPNSSIYQIAWCLILAFLAIYENAIFYFFLGTVWVETCHRHGQLSFAALPSAFVLWKNFRIIFSGYIFPWNCCVIYYTRTYTYLERTYFLYPSWICKELHLPTLHSYPEYYLIFVG